MAKLLGIKTLRSMAYHPQTNRETERVNQELKIYFWIFCSNNPRMWKLLNSLMKFSHNQTIHSTTKQTLFYLMMGYEPKDIPLVFDRTNTGCCSIWTSETENGEKSTWGFTLFKKGEQVWLVGWNLKIGYLSRKLAPKQEEPFMITEVLGPVTYHLKLLNQRWIHYIFHTSLLSPHRKTKTHSPNLMKPPSDLIKGEEEYEIEAIMSHKKWVWKYQYLIKWKG